MQNLILTALIALVLAAPAAADDFALGPTPPSQDEQLLGFVNLNRGAIDVLRDERDRLDGGLALSNALGAHQFDPYGAGPQWSVSVGGWGGEGAASAALLVPAGGSTALTFMGGASSAGEEGAAMALSGRW